MNHLKMHSLNKIDENVSKIAALFPNCVTEAKAEDGSITKKIDFDMLKQELSSSFVEGREERYQFTWPDKKKSVLLANAPIPKTLRPCREESVDFDNTENLYIEGDNLEVLKLLQETYLGKIKMIYIDPPYNTGNDFVYEDDFAQNASDYIANSGQTDEEGNRLVANTESNGRFHTDWLNMMYPRLKLARDLLSDDGVIFISIDDSEVKNLRNVCDELYGEQNFVNHIIWHKKYGTANDAKYLSDVHDHILLYCKNKHNWSPNLFERPDELNAKYKNPDNDPRGPWIATNLSVKTYSAANDYVIKSPAGLEFTPPPSRCWVVSKEKYEEMLADNRITFGVDGKSRPYKKTFLSEVQNGIVPTTIWSYDDAGHTIGAKSEIRDLFKDIKTPFDTPKPTKLIKKIIELAESKTHDDYILDFFAGSGTTADAVMQKNMEDSGKRKFIMIQINEPTQEKSIAKLEGFDSVSQISKERIRRAGKKIKEDSPFTTENLDHGFRVLKVDSTNMEDVYYTPGHIDTNDLFKNNIKPDRTAEDLLFQVMLDLGIMLSSKIETKKINGKNVFCVEKNYLMSCFDESVDEVTITEIAKEKPYYFVMRDPSESKDGDSLITNFEQIFTTYSPDTVRKVL
ncbi:site-specific DNA-methyltransferase [Treponema parvum]|uniref:site-specific DNA-methyltransferase (adenine-specific) n=1 Tax=Treponema parvum TaxID=138851 RepID=A0A975F0I2_9SPIR|nr:site-specific DNA-methyltransferase [Treponema parvum]QTQ12201.1 site-specific DNA-methyltransferase [Treponema parvum]